ncbi:methyltransferase domain-containing protein [Natrialba swarupiae]|uniref:Class I SAM-dependent methyltransferase n=1 Tax=Natrialba swarupiae TaxID=2448032 RepID=A0A5D5AN81_9EURY|nr:hypothetical protein [Natrialba swarupiae]MCW8172576.1 hypothetical protein [Natrialba swarupiae]TYT63126.1 hypothetical protein FYC77_05655 [Natrialba swarupiae]
MGRGEQEVTLPIPDGVEYDVDNLEAAIDELARVLRPGGRAVVYHTDWDSLVWRSTNRSRANRVLEAVSNHCPRPHL